MKNSEKSMEKIVALCKGRGFIFPGSDIYGGLANTWDYGPLGSRLKNNVKDTWRKRFIQERKNSYEVDADILMHPRVWEASGNIRSGINNRFCASYMYIAASSPCTLYTQYR